MQCIFVKEMYFSSENIFDIIFFVLAFFYYRDLEEYVSLDTKNVIQLQVVADLESTEVPYLFLPRKLKNHPNLAPSWLVEVICSSIATVWCFLSLAPAEVTLALACS